MEGEKEFSWADLVDSMVNATLYLLRFPTIRRNPPSACRRRSSGNTNQVFQRFVIEEKLIPTPINIHEYCMSNNF